MDVTYYKSSTFNQFYRPQLTVTSTNNGVFLNGGQVDNQGVEMALRFDDTVGKFNYGTFATWTWNANKIIDLQFRDPETGEIHDGNGMTVAGLGHVQTILHEGGSLGDIYVSSLAQDESGLYKLNNAGMVIPDETMIYAGTTDAKHRLSWGGHLGYGGFTANFLFTARLGGVVVSQTQAIMDYFGVSKDSADKRDEGVLYFNGMKNTDIQGYYQVLGGQQVMSQYVYDASNVRLQEVSLSYDFPVSKWNNWVKGLKLSVFGNNLWMLYRKAPFDPEMTANVGTYNQGIDYFMQPSTRSLGFSVKLKFGGSTASHDLSAAIREPQVVEKIVEKIVEKPVEKIVEKRVEVPVNKNDANLSDDLFFVINKAELRPEEAFKLGRLCRVLEENPEAKITVTGYADSATGTDKINQDLSARRAQVVVDLLKKAGIAASRIISGNVGGDRDKSLSPESNRVAVCIVK